MYQSVISTVLSFAAPRNAYVTSDGNFVALSCGTQNTTLRLFEAIGRPELILDPRFASNADRITNAESLDEIIGAWFSARTRSEALEVMERQGVTAGPVYSPADVFQDEHVRARGSVISVPDEELGEIWMQAPIPRLTATPGSIRFAGRKDVGADNAAVLAEIQPVRGPGAPAAGES